MGQIPKALTIAGSDCSGGAGVQADLKTFAAHGVYGMSVIVSVVAENTVRVISVCDVDPKVIEDQIDAVFEDVAPDAVKIGMLSSAACMDAVASGLGRWRPRHVVMDPVMYAKGGAALMAPDAIGHFREVVMPFATVLTPNIPEAEHLSGMRIGDFEAQVEAAKSLAATCGAAVLVKGGHAQKSAGAAAQEFDEANSIDVLCCEEGLFALGGKRYDTPHTHGTGCTLSSAIAANLARGHDTLEAARRAKSYVSGAIAHGLAIGAGHGPTDHFFYLYKNGLSGTGCLPDDLPDVTCERIGDAPAP